MGFCAATTLFTGGSDVSSGWRYLMRAVFLGTAKVLRPSLTNVRRMFLQFIGSYVISASPGLAIEAQYWYATKTM